MKFCSTNMIRKQETPEEVNILPRGNAYKIDQQEIYKYQMAIVANMISFRF